MRNTNVSVAHKRPTTSGMAVVTTSKPRGRPPKQVAADTVGGRLQRLRLDHQLSQEDLASILGITRTMISKYEDNTHPMTPEALRRVASRFDVTPSFILFGDVVEYAHRSAPIVGRVGAGAEVEAVQEANPEYVEVPADFDGGRAFRVEGDSCLPIFEPGDVLVVRDRAASEGEFLNRYCVVETADGFGYVKRVVRGATVPGRGQLYTLESPNAEEISNVQIRSARPVQLRILRSWRQ